MPTLQDIKKENGLTNVAIGKTLQCSPGKVGMILQGRYIHTFTDEEIAQLAQALSNYYNITFERCWLAMCESYNEWAKTLGMEHERADELSARVQTDMQKKWPDLGIEVDKPRETAIESVLVVPEERRLT